jgi:hypothetical protein
MIATERTSARNRAAWVMSGAVAVLATAALQTGCAENCTLKSVPAVEVALEAEDGAELVEASHSATFGGKEIGPIACEAGSCERLVVFAGVEPEGDFELTLEISAPAFVPITVTYEIESDGCHPITQQDSLELRWRPSTEICSPFCANAFGCETNVPWASEAECTQGCVVDIADPPPDACALLYRGLYACLGAGTCDDYLAYRNEEPGHRCEPHLDAINECESAW